MSSAEPLSTKDALLSHIHAVIYEQTPDLAGRITGMLADSPVSHLMQLLNDPHLLQARVEEASKSIQKAGAVSVEVKTDLGDALFSQVSDLEPSLCAQITGMLLELDRNVLEHLLQDPEAMSQTVTKAAEEYLARTHAAQDTSQSMVSEKTGEHIYLAVSAIYPHNAAKITGMLAELGEKHLQQLINDWKSLKEKVEICRSTLESTDQWLSE